MPSLPSLLTQDVTPGTRLFATFPGSSTSSPTSPFATSLELRGSGDLLSRQGQVRSEWGQMWRGREACGDGLRAESAVCGSQRDVNTDKTSWLLSWLQWKYLWFSPSALFKYLILFRKSLAWDLDGMFEAFSKKWDETGGRGRLQRSPSKNPLLS